MYRRPSMTTCGSFSKPTLPVVLNMTLGSLHVTASGDVAYSTLLRTPSSATPLYLAARTRGSAGTGRHAVAAAGTAGKARVDAVARRTATRHSTQ